MTAVVWELSDLTTYRIDVRGPIAARSMRHSARRHNAARNRLRSEMAAWRRRR